MARKNDILGYTDAAQLQRRSTGAVMNTADVLTAHFGIYRRCAATASEFRRCNRICPTLQCLLTQLVGMASISTEAAETFMIFSWWCLLGLGKWHLPAIQFILTVWLIPILARLSSRWTVSLRTEKFAAKKLAGIWHKIVFQIKHLTSSLFGQTIVVFIYFRTM